MQIDEKMSNVKEDPRGKPYSNFDFNRRFYEVLTRLNVILCNCAYPRTLFISKEGEIGR